MFKKNLSEIYIMLAAVLWGMIGISVTGLADMGMGRMDVVFIRSMVAFVTLGIYMLFVDKSAFRIRIKDIWCFLGTGIVSLMFFNMCYFSAIQHTSLAVAAVLLYTAPAFVVIISAFVFKEKVTLYKVFLLVAMFAGCVCTTGLLDEKSDISVVGIIYGLGSGVGYAMYSIFSRFAINRGYSSASISVYTFLFSTVGSAFFTEFENIGLIFNSEGVFYSLFIGIVCCTLPYILYTKGLGNMDNGKAATLAMAEPLVATVISIIWFDDTVTVWKITGIIVMFGAMGFMNMKKD